MSFINVLDLGAASVWVGGGGSYQTLYVHMQWFEWKLKLVSRHSYSYKIIYRVKTKYNYNCNIIISFRNNNAPTYSTIFNNTPIFQHPVSERRVMYIYIYIECHGNPDGFCWAACE